MKVFVNNQEVKTFKGARLRHVLLRFGYKASQLANLTVLDHNNFEADLTGPVREGSSYSVSPKQKNANPH